MDIVSRRQQYHARDQKKLDTLKKKLHTDDECKSALLLFPDLCPPPVCPHGNGLVAIPHSPLYRCSISCGKSNQNAMIVAECYY